MAANRTNLCSREQFWPVLLVLGVRCVCASFTWASFWQDEDLMSRDEAQKVQEKHLHLFLPAE